MFWFVPSSGVSPPLLSVLPPFLLCPLEGANFRSILDKAVQADQVVKERYSTHCEMIALLCKPENELTAAIPSANPTKTLQGSEVCTPLTRGSHDLVMGLLQHERRFQQHASLAGAVSCVRPQFSVNSSKPTLTRAKTLCREASKVSIRNTARDSSPNVVKDHVRLDLR